MTTEYVPGTSTKDLPDDTILPGHQWSLGEMRQTIATMRSISSRFYDTMFVEGVGSRCHQMVEFCGLLNVFIDMCAAALDAGIEFPLASTHGGAAWPMATHKAAYLGEKFNCIWGFHIASDPELRAAFEAQAWGDKPR